VTGPQKITFGEMRAMGVRGLLVYCSDYHCSHWTRSAAISGLMMFGCQTSSSALRAKLARRRVPISVRISIGNERPVTRT
jgi:hypothetical protein